MREYILLYFGILTKQMYFRISIQISRTIHFVINKMGFCGGLEAVFIH